jgi:predicted amidophosphoribosyltransferase
MTKRDRREYAREYQRKRRSKKQERGECLWCRNQAENNHRFCADCLEKGRLRAQESARKKRAAKAETTETTPEAAPI